MKHGFLLMFGVVLALGAVSGIVQSLIFLIAIIGAGNIPGAEWFLSLVIAVAFAVAAAISFRSSGTPSPASHWSASLAGGVLGVLAGAVLKGVAYLLIGTV
jgi:hypothetical protein